MGLIHSRRINRPQEAESVNNDIYKYPPKSGHYFGGYFYMGGERFDTMRPDAYLFGENEDLNFLGNKPAPFNFSLPQPNEVSKTLKSLINIRKDSLKLVKVGESDAPTSIIIVEPVTQTDFLNNIPKTEIQFKGLKNKTTSTMKKLTPPSSTPATNHDTPKTTENNNNPQVDKPIVHQSFNIEFTFDTDVKCAITIYYFATEEYLENQAVYMPKDADMNSETFHYKRGSNQVFSQASHLITPSLYPDSQWQYDTSKEIFPIVIQCVAEEDGQAPHNHCTYAVIERLSDGGYCIKALKQKQWIGGVAYLLQEIYGIENKNVESNKDDDTEDTGSECVICMSETRDTIILPCRHLCLCNGCADNLRYQANNCPICRAKFRALLQIKAIQKKNNNNNNNNRNNNKNQSRESGERWATEDGVPAGFEAISLVEALNGPTLPHRAKQVATNLPHNLSLLQNNTNNNLYANIENDESSVTNKNKKITSVLPGDSSAEPSSSQEIFSSRSNTNNKNAKKIKKGQKFSQANNSAKNYNKPKEGEEKNESVETSEQINEENCTDENIPIEDNTKYSDDDEKLYSSLSPIKKESWNEAPSHRSATNTATTTSMHSDDQFEDCSNEEFDSDSYANDPKKGSDRPREMNGHKMHNLSSNEHQKTKSKSKIADHAKDCNVAIEGSVSDGECPKQADN